MIILIASEKGGTGKTTLATNLAALRSKEKREVLLLDTDPQGSASFWTNLRDETEAPQVYCIQKFGDISKEIKKLERKFDDIIIDAGGRDSRELRSSTLVSDKMYIPIQSSQFDIWSVGGMDMIVGRATEYNPDLIAKIIINRASTNVVVKETGETQELIDELENISLSESIIKERIAFRKAAREGLSVCEMAKVDPKAANEIESMYKEVFNA